MIIAKRNIGESAVKQLKRQNNEEFNIDMVDSPSHYMLFPDAQVIDIIEKALSPQEYMGYLKGNVLKYRLRAGDKGDLVEDINKAHKYQDWLREL